MAAEASAPWTTLELHELTAADRNELLAFVQRLPTEALLFLRRDIRRPEEIDRWLAATGRATLATTVALDASAAIRGYVVVDRGELPWRQHVAELRVLVEPNAEAPDLLYRLLQHGLDEATRQGASKLVVRLTPAQEDEQRMLLQLGFLAEARLRGHVRDTAGRTHDLLIYSLDLDARRQRSCEGCGRAAPHGLMLAGRHLCWSCYGTEEAELGNG